MADGVMLVRQMLRAEVAKSFSHTPLTEETLAELVHLYWSELSDQDRQRIQNKAQRNWFCDLSSADDSQKDNSHLIHAHHLHQDTFDPTLSTDIPVLGDFGYQSRPLAKPSKRYELGKKIVAAQLSKQFTPVPVHDSYLNRHIPREVIVALNEKSSERSLKLRRYSEMTLESEMKESLKQFRLMKDCETALGLSELKRLKRI
jgi:hypothetical protein